jgi:subtilisin family serine protease
MRIAKMILFLVAACVVAGTASAGELSPGLEAYLLDKAADGPVKALLVLDDQVDVTAMDLDLHYERATRAVRHFQVVTALQEKARLTQGPLLAELDSRLGKDVEGYKAYWLINAVTVVATEQALRELVARADVMTAEVDLVPELIEPTAKPEIGEKSTRGIGIAPGIVAVGARRVWDQLGIRGEGALIGSLDTGVDGNHPALAARWRGTHAPASECWLDVLGTGTTFPQDGNSHGTHTTGTMTGLAPDDTIGIAPAAEWIAANAIDQGANPGFDNDILDCLEFFTDPDGDPTTLDDVPDVVQNSWRVNEGFSGYVDCDSRWWAAIDACEAAGVALCWSAGNEGSGASTIGSPADRATTLYNCFSVGATHHYQPYPIWSFSSRGPAGPNCGPVENRTKPEITAPGADIYSAVPGGGYQGGWNGTSMSGPHVAGVMALMRSANPNVDVITMKQVLMETANDLGQTGDDNTYGHGFLDAFEAVQAVMGGLGYVEGSVTDLDTGDPIEGALITVTDGFQTATTEADGSYRLILPVGSSQINAAAFGYADLSVSVTVNEDQTVYRDLELERVASATISGVVYTPDSELDGGTPVNGAIVEVMDTPLSSVTTAADGRFEFLLPVGGEFRIAASAAGIGAVSQWVPVDGDLELALFLGDLTMDGFETGNLNALPWSSSGNADWFVQTSTVHAGTYAAQSGNIGDQQSSSLQVTVDCGAGGEVSFWYKVSSEANYDYLQFYVDGSQRVEWAGEVGWAEYTTTVTGGNHTFRWTFDKDWSVSDGSDCGWIDEVTFPGGATPTPRIVPAPMMLETTVAAGQSAVLPLVVMNQGAADLDVTATANGFVSLDSYATTIDPSSYQVFLATLDSDGLLPGYHTTTIALASNDPAYPSVQVPVALTVSGDTTPVGDAPRAFQLVGAVPNPFNPQTVIHYALPSAGPVRLRLYDVQGRLVRTLVDGVQASGPQEVTWDGRDRSGRPMASGTYFARLEQGVQHQVKSLVLVR